MSSQTAPFAGLSSFLLTPHDEGAIDHARLAELTTEAASGGATSIGAIGSTGGYAYLDRQSRKDAARTVIDAAGSTPVIVGVGGISTAAVLQHINDALSVGAAGVMLAPLSYQRLSDEEVFGLFADVSAASDAPVIVYDNPVTTGFTFTKELLAQIAQLPGIASIKLSELPADWDEAKASVARLRERIPASVGLGISGDAAGAHGLLAGCDTWFSVVSGTLPVLARGIAEPALAGDRDTAFGASARLTPIWDLFARYGSFRTIAAIATEIGGTEADAVFAPVRPLEGEARDAVRTALQAVGTSDLRMDS